MLLFLVVSYFPCRCRRNSHVLPDPPLPLAVSSICSSINAVDRRSGLQASSFKITSPQYCSRPLNRIHTFRIQFHLSYPRLDRLGKLTTAELDRQLIGGRSLLPRHPASLSSEPAQKPTISPRSLPWSTLLLSPLPGSWDVLGLDLDAGMDARRRKGCQ